MMLSSKLTTRQMKFLARHAYAIDHFVWVFLGAFSVLLAFSYFFGNAPASNVLTKEIHPYEDIWTGGFGVSGVMLMYGILFAKPHWEALGHAILSSALLMYWVFLLFQASTAIGVYTYPALIIASMLRFAMLVLLANFFRTVKNDDLQHRTLAELSREELES
jgi:hypothetical protein